MLMFPISEPIFQTSLILPLKKLVFETLSSERYDFLFHCELYN